MQQAALVLNNQDSHRTRTGVLSLNGSLIVKTLLSSQLGPIFREAGGETGKALGKCIDLRRKTRNGVNEPIRAISTLQDAPYELSVSTLRLVAKTAVLRGTRMFWYTNAKRVAILSIVFIFVALTFKSVLLRSFKVPIW
jgi:hypothetical protein